MQLAVLSNHQNGRDTHIRQVTKRNISYGWVTLLRLHTS
jgi:hypothetical protein